MTNQITLALITIGLILAFSTIVTVNAAQPTQQQKVTICKAVMKGIENFKATYKTPPYNNSISKLSNFMIQNMSEPLAVLAGWHLYNQSCSSITGSYILK